MTSDRNRSDFWEMFRRVEADIWRVAHRVHPSYVRGGYDCWVLCPREHAKKRLRCIVELTPDAYPGLPGMLWLAKEQFSKIGRFFDGEDLVFAVGDNQ
jgi:hypothetical protein